MRIKIGDKRPYIKAGTRIEDAKKLLLQLEEAKSDGALGIHRPVEALFCDLSAEYFEYYKAKSKRRNWQNVKSVVNRLNKFFGQMELREISLWSVESYVRKRTELVYLNAILNKAMEWSTETRSYLEKTPQIKMLPVQKTRARVLTEHEIESILSYEFISGGHRDAIMVALDTGMRLIELVLLSSENLGAGGRVAHLEDTKSLKSRTIPITDELVSDYRHLIGGKKTGAVFESNRGGSLTLRQVNWIVATAGERSGVKNPNPKYSRITCHLFRHSFAREWKRLGGSIETLSKILGHTSVKTTLDEYGTEDLEDVRRNYDSIINKMV